MRMMIAGLALFCVACVGVNSEGGDGEDSARAPAGYTLEVRASEAERFFLVTSPDGRVVAARASEGVSALMAEPDVQALLAAAPVPSSGERREVVSLRLPGINLSVSGDPDSGGGDGGGRVSIDAGGHSVEVNASEGGPGEADDNAQVLIRGVHESEARAFIAKADALSPAVQAQMLAGLGLE